MKMELKTSTFQLENSEESLTSRTGQVDARLSGLKDKIEELDHVSKEF